MSHGIRAEDVAWQAFQAGARHIAATDFDAVKAGFIKWWTARRDQGCALPECEKCGYDSSAKVTAQWTFVIDRDPPSLNERLHNQGATRFAYAKQRNEWASWFKLARNNNRIPIAKKRRRVTLTRVYCGRQQQRDRDNLAGGMKPCVDAMVVAGLLCDDSDRWVQINYAQERGEHRGLRVLIEELA